MKHVAKKGFTLIELAVVIAIIAILAAVAIPRYTNMTESAERAMAQDFLSQLNSAAAMWTAQNAQAPTGFDDFVSNAALPANPVAGDPVLSTANFGSIPGGCGAPGAGAAGTIDCSGAFNSANVAPIYSFNNGAFTVAGI